MTLKSGLGLWVCIPRFLPMEPRFCMHHFILSCGHGKKCFSSNECSDFTKLISWMSKTVFSSFNSDFKTSPGLPADYSASIVKQDMPCESQLYYFCWTRQTSPGLSADYSSSIAKQDILYESLLRVSWRHLGASRCHCWVSVRYRRTSTQSVYNTQNKASIQGAYSAQGIYSIQGAHKAYSTQGEYRDTIHPEPQPDLLYN